MAVFCKALALIIGLIGALQARADAFLGDEISVTGFVGFGPVWGSSATPVPGSDNGMLHTAGGASFLRR